MNKTFRKQAKLTYGETEQWMPLGSQGLELTSGGHEETQVDAILSILIKTVTQCKCQNNVQAYFTVMYVLP